MASAFSDDKFLAVATLESAITWSILKPKWRCTLVFDSTVCATSMCTE